MPIPLRKFSQNWLANNELAIALVRSIQPHDGDHFLEIGPGDGRMTRALLQHHVKVTAIEVDKRCCEALEALDDDSDGRLSVIHRDVLDFDPTTLNEPGGIGGLRKPGLRFVGNLPYAIVTMCSRSPPSASRSSARRGASGASSSIAAGSSRSRTNASTRSPSSTWPGSRKRSSGAGSVPVT